MGEIEARDRLGVCCAVMEDDYFLGEYTLVRAFLKSWIKFSE